MNKALGLFVLLNVSLANAQTTSNNKIIIQQFYEAFNQGNLALASTFYASVVQLRSAAGTSYQLTKEMLQKSIEGSFKAFPDGKNEIITIMADGDWVAVCDRRTGTNLGPWMGIEATGKTTDFLVMEMYRLHQGKIVEIMVVHDHLTALKQLGIIPSDIRNLLPAPLKK
ncbi:MAG: ester cyclase [Spirosomataceae bacterium]